MYLSYMLGFIAGALFVAFFGCRFLKLSITLEAIYLGYILGADVIGIAISDRFEGVDISNILGIILAILCGLIAVRLYKVMIYLIGAMFGGGIGFAIPYYLLLAFSIEESVAIIAGIVVAIILAIIFAKLMLSFFKVLVILTTSFYGAYVASSAIAELAVGTESSLFTIVTILATLVIGVFAMVAQFKINKDRPLL